MSGKKNVEALPVYRSGDYLNRDAPRPPLPHAWIQWKGTSVCMDVHCICGTHGHVDDEFAYHLKCEDCGRVYDVEGFVRLHEMPDGVPKGQCEPIPFRDIEAVPGDPGVPPPDVVVVSFAVESKSQEAAQRAAEWVRRQFTEHDRLLEVRVTWKVTF